MKFAQTKRQQQALYTALVILAVLAGITLLSSLNEQKQTALERERAEQKRQQDAQQKTQEALAAITSVHQYRSYCTAGVQHIDVAGGNIIRLSYAGTRPFAYYVNDKRIECPKAAATPGTECATLQQLAFQTAYTCASTSWATILAGGNGLQIKTQIAGTAVIVDKVVVANPSFIVIYDDNGKHQPGSLIAHSMILPAGAYDIVSIAIPSPLKVSRRYYASIYVDTDANTVFNNALDKPLLGQDGKQVFAEFTTVKN